MTRLQRINKAIREYDRDLFAKEETGSIAIYRKCKEWRSYNLGDGTFISELIVNPWRVISLTENWSVNSKRVEWGIDVIINRLKACDLWNNGMTFEDFKELDEKYEKSRDTDRRNTIESFLYEFRSGFAKSTNDINTSSLSKFDKRRIQDASYK